MYSAMTEQTNTTDEKEIVKLQEGEKVQLFRFAFRNIFKKVAAGVSLERFTELYSDVLRNKKKRAVTLYNIMVQTLENGLRNHFEHFIEEDNLNEKFMELSKIIDECAVDKNIKSWRPTGDVIEHLQSFDVQEKLKRKKELEAFVEEEEVKVQHLQLEVSAKRQKVKMLEEDALKLESKLLSHYVDTRKIPAVLDVHLQELLNLTWDIKTD